MKSVIFICTVVIYDLKFSVQYTDLFNTSDNLSGLYALGIQYSSLSFYNSFQTILEDNKKCCKLLCIDLQFNYNDDKFCLFHEQHAFVTDILQKTVVFFSQFLRMAVCQRIPAI
jgi:hypothetical protein